MKVYAELRDGCTTFTLAEPCKHLNGWYHTVPFGPFSRRVYACQDCGWVLYGKRLKEWRAKAKEVRGC